MMQTFSFNFCRCVVRCVGPPCAEGEAGVGLPPQLLVAISGSSPADIELWDLQVR